MSYYDYEELRANAIKETATAADRLALFDWLEEYGSSFWNGESYNINDGLNCKPIYKQVDEDDFEIIDVEIK